MPSRYIRDGWLDSDRIRAAGEPAEVLFVRLALVSDDYGRGDRRISVIRSRCWPVDDPEYGPKPPPDDEIRSRLESLITQRLVIPYEVGGKPYYYIPKFKQRTRSGSKFPDPPADHPQESLHAGQVAVTTPPDAGQPAAHWRQADGGPQARSRSSTSTESRHDGHPADKRPSKPMLPAKAVTKTQQIIEESRQAAALAAPPPGGSAMELLKRVTAGKGNGAPPPDPAPREPGQDEDEHEQHDDSNDLDLEAKSLGMKRMAFENDEALQTRINARRALG